MIKHWLRRVMHWALEAHPERTALRLDIVEALVEEQARKLQAIGFYLDEKGDKDVSCKNKASSCHCRHR